jgi:hypothetical protein
MDVTGGDPTGGDPTGGDPTDGDGPGDLPADCSGDVLEGDVFAPNEVYLAGTLSEGACYLDALAHWSSPNDAVVGFDCYFNERTAMIRPTDGRLLYTNTFEDRLREFHCDDCPWTPASQYPASPLANDTILPTPACDSNSQQLRFLVTPDGSYLYRCAATGWFAADSNVVYDDTQGELLYLGYDNMALTASHVLDLDQDSAMPIDGLPVETPLTIRADPQGGFLLVIGDAAQPELWHVDADGTAANQGAFPNVPDGYAPSSEHTLDGCNVLYQLGGGPETFEDVILRRPLGGQTEVVYTENTDPVVKVHISGLVTGV